MSALPTCRAYVTCHECDRDHEARCGLAPEHEGDHVPAVDVEIAALRAECDRLRQDVATLQRRREEALRHVESARPALKWVRDHAPRHDDHDQAHAQLALDHVHHAIDTLRGFHIKLV